MKLQTPFLAFLLLFSSFMYSQENVEPNDEELSEEAKLAKATQNPLAAMYVCLFKTIQPTALESMTEHKMY